MSVRTSAMLLAIALGLSACGGDDGGPAGGGGAGASDPAFTQASLPCAPGTMASCACLGGGTGIQSCLPGGQGYGTCTGCPPGPAAGDSSAAGRAAPAAELDAGAGDATVMTMDAGSAADDGDTPADAGADGAVERLGIAPRGTAPGISCGVGLPVLCELQTQKCCARSLRTDSCIGAADSCECDLPDCTVMEAHCDGPEDCPDGQVCCGTLAGSTGYSRFECASSCDYDGTQRIACHQDDPQCPAGRSCENSQLLTNLQVCIDPATIQQ
ncbi:MAG: hypothetical protein PVI30_20360 [Myxococcales bacterium]|jgi:hypothetical protein